ncbi:MAG: hypothetical protein WBQ29_08025, partial [Isosphaeraceae bacterium]
ARRTHHIGLTGGRSRVLDRLPAKDSPSDVLEGSLPAGEDRGSRGSKSPISRYDELDHSGWPGSDRLKIAQQRRGVRHVGAAWGVMKVTG